MSKQAKGEAMTPRFTVDQFSDDPEVWNVRDPSGKIVSQQDSKPDADGLAMVYDSIYHSGYDAALTSERAKVERLREAATRAIGVWDAYMDPYADTTDAQVCTAITPLRTALKETT